MSGRTIDEMLTELGGINERIAEVTRDSGIAGGYGIVWFDPEMVDGAVLAQKGGAELGELLERGQQVAQEMQDELTPFDKALVECVWKIWNAMLGASDWGDTGLPYAGRGE